MSTDTVSCPHADLCAGCPSIALPYGAQLARKKELVAAAMAPYGDSLSAVLAISDVRPAELNAGYRSRAKLMAAPGPRIGLYARDGGHIVVDIPECRVLTPALREVADGLRDLLREPPSDAGPALRPITKGTGALYAVDLREVEEEGGPARVLVTLVLLVEGCSDETHWARAARAVRERCPAVTSVAVNLRRGNSPQVLGSRTVVVEGPARARDKVGKGRAVYQLATHGSFVQANRGQAAAIQDLIAREIDASSGMKGARVLDLYGGTGPLALHLASLGAKVDLVESFAPAAEQAERAAAEQGLAVKAQRGDASEVARQLASAKRAFDAIVANPPRRGIAPEARAAIAALKAPLIAYVSCDPHTLARDLDHFAHLGYAARDLSLFDMIPLTDEVETVAFLRRSPPLVPRVAHEDKAVVFYEKPPHGPLVLDSTRRGTLIERLEDDASGLIAVARTPDVVEKWKSSLAAPSARRIYLVAAKGVTPQKGNISRPTRPTSEGAAPKTRYRRIGILGGHSILRVISDDLSPHQVRRHLASIGHPVLGDTRYGHGPSNRYFEEKYGLDRSFLHVTRRELTHPDTGKELVVDATLPGDLALVLSRLGGAAALALLKPGGERGENASAKSSRRERSVSRDSC